LRELGKKEDTVFKAISSIFFALIITLTGTAKAAFMTNVDDGTFEFRLDIKHFGSYVDYVQLSLIFQDFPRHKTAVVFNDITITRIGQTFVFTETDENFSEASAFLTNGVEDRIIVLATTSTRISSIERTEPDALFGDASGHSGIDFAGLSIESVELRITDLFFIHGFDPNQGAYTNIAVQGKVTIRAPVLSAVEAFVTRFYRLCLDRNPDQTGLDGWVSALLAGTQTGSDVANGFVFSQEFINKNTTDLEYVTILYEAFFNRQPDSAGLQGWLDAIANGASREDVLNGFIYATEFAELCEEYGIKAFEGHIAKAQREAVENFVTRFYQLCLDRNPDPAGLDGWTNNLLNQIQTGADVANGFVYSQEFINKNTSNDEYLTILYRAFFNRDPDQAGWDVWIAELNSGRDRGDVLSGFLGSQEFIKLCETYGIVPF
jgi:hypothetical protein